MPIAPMKVGLFLNINRYGFKMNASISCLHLLPVVFLALVTGALSGRAETAGSGEDPAVWFASRPAVSPDGETVVFSWRRDLWMVPTAGGRAVRLTSHPSTDSFPLFSPDGGVIYFGSFRDGPRHLYSMPSGGGAIKRLSHHSGGLVPEAVFPDGGRVVARALRDHPGFQPHRLFTLPTDRLDGAETLLFNVDGHSVSIHPDGGLVLFVRNGEQAHRKGYRGSRASSIWLYEMETEEFRLLIGGEEGSRSPLWRPDGKSYYHVWERDGAWNLWLHDLEGDSHVQKTFFQDDGVRDPSLSTDGRVMVFNRGVELWIWHPGSGREPAPIPVTHHLDKGISPVEVRQIRGTGDADFSPSGLEIAFAAEGRLFVMDTVLRQPNPITMESDLEYSSPRFSPDGRYLRAIEDSGFHRWLVRFERKEADAFWWKARSFRKEVLAGEAAPVHSYRISPDQTKMAWMEGNGRLMAGNPDGENARPVHQSWEPFEYDWAPDGRWLAVATRDQYDNRDIHIICVEGSRPPYNLSRHPGNEWSPVWSPDGRKIAFLGQRSPNRTRIHLVHLSLEDHLRTETEIRREEALKTMRDDPWYASDAKKDKGTEPISEPPPNEARMDLETDAPFAKVQEQASEPAQAAEEEPSPEELCQIDFDDLHERIITLDTGEGVPFRLFWSHDSRHLWFQTTSATDNAVYQIEPRSGARRTRMAQHRGIPLRADNAHDSYWIVENAPAKLSRGRLASHAISIDVQRVRRDHLQLGFLLAWRMIRDRFYDPGLNNLDWEAVRDKYLPLASAAGNSTEFSEVLQMMFGELNASHLGFAPATWPPTGSSPEAVFQTTRHTGLRWQSGDNGKVVVKQVIPGTPAHAARPRIQAGDLLIEVDGAPVLPGVGLATLFNGSMEEDVRLKLRRPETPSTEPVEHRLRAISYAEARELAHAAFLAQTREAVETLSEGRLGYIHVERMRQENLEDFQHRVFTAGFGRDGLVIDVRGNRGGSITDHLLTILTQPRHAITMTRDGEPGYPASRTPHGFWHKPVVVLCDENSFSNAEIFAHAVQQIGRGQLVGRPTEGGVISTLRESLLDLGRINIPFRGWFHGETGLDMELGPAVPDHLVDAHPSDLSVGTDRQLKKAVEVLLAEMEENPPSLPRPVFRRSTF